MRDEAEIRAMHAVVESDIAWLKRASADQAALEYREGVMITLAWVLGLSDEKPLND